MRINGGIRAKSNFHSAGKRVCNILPRRRNDFLCFSQTAGEAGASDLRYRSSSLRDRASAPDKCRAPSWRQCRHRQCTTRARWNRRPPPPPSEFPRSVRVRRDFAAQPVRVGHDGFHLLQRVLRVLRIVAQRKHAARGAYFDQIGAVLDVLANLVLHGRDAIGDAVAGGVIFETAACCCRSVRR